MPTEINPEGGIVREGRGGRGAGEIALWMLYPLFFVSVYLAHLPLLRLPYFWDEGGYYVPAAWDFFRTGTLIPESTVTNAHPPLPSIILAAWWHLSGFVVSGTRTVVCLMAASALLAVFKMARELAGSTVAAIVVVLTAIYPVWFVQSTLAHADIFAAAFTLWGLAVYLDPTEGGGARRVNAAMLFSLSVLAKETAIVTPVALALWEILLLVWERRVGAVQATHAQGTPVQGAHARGTSAKAHLSWVVALVSPVVPLIAWYAYHFHKTGFVFGNPEFLRYNATANLDARRVGLGLWHRLLHLATHMNMFVPVFATIAVALIPVKDDAPAAIPRAQMKAIGVVVAANWIAFSVLGGALLTRYLLPVFPLILLVCVATWQRHLKPWRFGLAAISALSAAAFLAGIWINPPYAFAPEDNLTYRDMIVLHQEAVKYIDLHYPDSIVLTAWPATSELNRPELGYTNHPVKTFPILNFSMEQVEKAGQDPGGYDTALVFSTKWQPAANHLDLGAQNRSADTKYFDFHTDLSPAEVATLLHGDVVWQGRRKGEWAAVLHFPRVAEATLVPR